MSIKNTTLFLPFLFILLSCSHNNDSKVRLMHAKDESAGGGCVYIISTPSAVYYLEKEGGGLSSLLDKDSVDWIGFHNKSGSAHKGEYRGFPNAIHKQDGNYFHAMNSKTNPSSSVVNIESDEHVRITFTSDNEQWKGQWNFYPNRCDFSMSKISLGYKYWIQYEGVPNGEMDSTYYWFASIDDAKHPIFEPFMGDLPAPEWMAFGDFSSKRMLYLLHHEDDELPDNYVARPDMTVLGFGRKNGETTTKHLASVQTFSIGFIESTEREVIDKTIRELVN